MRQYIIPGLIGAALTFAALLPGGQQNKQPEPTLRQELYQLDQMRGNSPEASVNVEQFGHDLLRRYKRREDRGRIYFQMAHVYAQSDIRRFYGEVEKFGRLALAFDRDAIQRATLRSYLASAAEVDPAQRLFEERRGKAAQELLQGYKELLAFRLPDTAPELPVVEKFDEPDGSPESIEAQKKHDNQMQTRQAAEHTRSLVEQRDTLMMQLRELYARPPDGSAELQRLAARILQKKESIDSLMNTIHK